MFWEEILSKYFIRYSSRIRAVTQPLKDHFGIPFFGYHRINTGGNYTVLTDRPDWAEYYLEKQLYLNDAYLKHPNHYTKGVCLFSSIDQSLCQTLCKQVQAEEGVILIEKDASSVEFFIFAGSHNNRDFSQLYLNHHALLKTFANHFKKEVSSILKSQEQERYTLPISEMKHEKAIQPILDENKKKSFLSAMGFANFWKQFHSLTPREKECLKQFLESQSIKETALALTLSPRTVEYYLENIKNKIGCFSKQDLINKAKSFQSLNII